MFHTNMEEAALMTYTATIHKEDSQDILDSHLGSCHGVHVYIKSMIQPETQFKTPVSWNSQRFKKKKKNVFHSFSISMW